MQNYSTDGEKRYFDTHLESYLTSVKTTTDSMIFLKGLPAQCDPTIAACIKYIFDVERKYNFLINNVDQLIFKNDVIEQNDQALVQSVMKDVLANSHREGSCSSEIPHDFESKLRHILEAESKYRFLVNHVEDIIFICTPDACINFLNPQWHQQLGFSIQESLQSSLFNYIHEQDEPLFREKFERIFYSGQKIINFEFRLMTAKGEWTHHLLTGIPISDSSGAVVEMLGVAHHISERRMLQKKLRHYNEQLEKRVKERTAEINAAYEELKEINMKLIQAEKMAAVGELASSVGHEFNNLIGIMQAYAEFTLSQRTEKNITKLIDAVLLSAKRASKITQSLLSFSRRIEHKQELADLNIALEEVLHLLENDFKKADITVIKQTESLPNIMVDIGQIEQVLLNLLVNAKHAIVMRRPEQGRIIIKTAELKNGIEISITDNGTGIKKENIDKIFTPFFSTKGNYGQSKQPGTGLGLSVSLGIIENHYGSITVDSKENVGTTFSIILPKEKNMTPIHTELAGSKRKEEIKSAGPSYKKAASVLVVDDEEYLRNALCDILSNEGYNLIPAENGEQAIQLFQNSHFDLVLMDVMIPGFNGIEIIKMLRSINPDIKIIVISSHSQSLTQLQLLKNRYIQGLIYKPFDLNKLISTISQVLENSN